MGIAGHALGKHQHLARFGKFDGIAHQIEQNLPQTQRIAHQTERQVRINAKNQFDPFALCAQGQNRGNVVEHLGKIEDDVFDLQFPGFDLRKVENVVENAKQTGGRRIDIRQIVALLQIELGLERQMRQPQDRIHRCSDFVAHIGQKLGFRLIGAIGLRLGTRQFDHGPFQFLVIRRQFLMRPLQGPLRLLLFDPTATDQLEIHQQQDQDRRPRHAGQGRISRPGFGLG